ncbi:carbohydrate ABC transporter permease [Virgibacillus sp. W0181]|uniref:carbohydrate ABC transporter permease n=1 Tax=Virgibacillus sp. W0181 TaxID=3391581 RepID=UPI003F4627C3
MKRKKRIMDVFTYIALTIISLVFLLPLLWILRTSLIKKVEAYQIPPKWLVTPTLDNYLAVINDSTFFHNFTNSLGISLISTILSLIFGSLAAYGFVRLRQGGGDTLKISILGTQMLPPIVLVIPIFVLIKSVGLLDSWIALIATYMTFSLPYVIWLLLDFFESVPKELDEAAEIDGASKFKGFIKVVIPIAAPGIISAGVFSFIMAWNEFIFALVLTGTKSRTLPVAIANLNTHQGVMIAELSASVILIVLPVILLSMFIQKYLVSGMSFGSLK